MGKFNIGIPESSYGWLGFGLGILGSILWGTQFIWNWFGITEVDKALFSVITLIILLFGCGFAYVANRLNHPRKKITGSPILTACKIALVGFMGIVLIVMVINGFALTMSTEYTEYAESGGMGMFTGLRQLTTITAEDVGSLQQFAVGIQWIVRALFLVVPCIIGTWGGLSVLTADSIDEAEGGILAVVAAFIVLIIVWTFKVIGVTLM